VIKLILNKKTIPFNLICEPAMLAIDSSNDEKDDKKMVLKKQILDETVENFVEVSYVLWYSDLLNK